MLRHGSLQLRKYKGVTEQTQRWRCEGASICSDLQVVSRVFIKPASMWLLLAAVAEACGEDPSSPPSAIGNAKVSASVLIKRLSSTHTGNKTGRDKK